MSASDTDIESTTVAAVLSIEEYKHLWVTCEEEKTEPRKILAAIGKKQRPATKAIRAYMEENEIQKLDCCSGWHMTCEEVEKVSFGEEVCSKYMRPDELALLKRENMKRKKSFKTLPPEKSQRTE